MSHPIEINEVPTRYRPGIDVFDAASIGTVATLVRAPELPKLIRRDATHRTADLIVNVLERLGVEVVFGIPGGTIASVNDALMDHPNIKVITSRHEGGAMFAAAGYARATGRLGVVIVTSGPGALNCMTGLASAHCDSLPVLVLAGEVPRRVFGKGALQDGTSSHLNIVAMARHITKYSAEVLESASAPGIVQKAALIALSGRPGPALLTLPLDVTSASVHRAGIVLPVEQEAVVNAGVCGKVANAIMSAERPVLFVGSGSRWGDGPALLKDLAERLQIPVMTTPKAKGVFPESHPLSLGVFGHGGHGSAKRYLQGGIDVIVVIGSGLGDPATDGWSKLLVPTAHFIQIDADAAQFGKNYEVSVGLVGKVEPVLRAILEWIPLAPRQVKTFGVDRICDPKDLDDPNKAIAPQRALWEVQRAVPKDALYACDIGEHLLFATHYLEIDDPNGFLAMTGLASMGSSIPGALGTMLALPGRPVVAICGDGCFAMGMGEIGTAVREKLPLLIVVLNDKRYGMVEIGHNGLYGRTPAYPCDELRIDVLARGLGATAYVVERPGDIESIDLVQALSHGPVVLDVRIDREVRMPNERIDALKKVDPTRGSVQ